MANRGPTTKVNAFVADPPAVSVTCAVNVNVPAVVGLPLSTPVLPSAIPGGGEPALTDQVNVPEPPDFAMMLVYDTPTWPGPTVLVVTDKKGTSFSATPLLPTCQ